MIPDYIGWFAAAWLAFWTFVLGFYIGVRACVWLMIHRMNAREYRMFIAMINEERARDSVSTNPGKDAE